MTVKEFVLDSLKKFYDKAKDYFVQKTDLSQILTVTPFNEGTVTTQQELFSKIKLNGKNITSIDELTNLNGKIFFIMIEDEAMFLLPCYYVLDNHGAIIRGGLIINDSGEEILIEIYWNHLEDSYIKLMEG